MAEELQLIEGVNQEVEEFIASLERLTSSQEIKDEIGRYCREPLKMQFGSTRLKALQDARFHLEQTRFYRNRTTEEIVDQRIEQRRVDDRTGRYDVDFGILDGAAGVLTDRRMKEIGNSGQANDETYQFYVGLYQDGLALARQVRNQGFLPQLAQQAQRQAIASTMETA